jgi:hypothetical protein
MGLNSGVLKRYLISIYTIKGWYDIARSDCIILQNYNALNKIIFSTVNFIFKHVY